MHYVYILRWDKYYCGCTNNLNRRMNQHISWNVRTTKILKINELVWYFEVADLDIGFELEKKIKKSKNIKKQIDKKWFIKVNRPLV